MPKGFTPAERRIWKDTVAILASIPGLMSIADGPVLADFCRTRANKDIVEADMRKEGMTSEVIGKYGRLLNQLRHRENVLRRELGLSPSSRSSIKISGEPTKPPVNALEAGLFGNAGPRLVKV